MGEIGNCADVRCFQNSYRRITDKTCRNECKYFKWNEKKQKRDCQLGYRKIKAYKPQKTTDSKES